MMTKNEAILWQVASKGSGRTDFVTLVPPKDSHGWKIIEIDGRDYLDKIRCERRIYFPRQALGIQPTPSRPTNVLPEIHLAHQRPSAHRTHDDKRSERGPRGRRLKAKNASRSRRND